MWALFALTRASTLRMKWTRQRCQADPTITSLDGRLQAQVVVRDDQADPGEPPGPQRAQERRPEGPVLGVARRRRPSTSRLPSIDHPGRHHHGPAHHLVADPALQVGGVEEDVGELDVAKRPGPEGLELGVELSADPRDLGLGDPGLEPESGHEVVDLAGRDPVHVGLHDHGEEGPVDAPAALEDARGRSVPWRSFGILSSTSPALVETSRSRVPLRWVMRLSARS